MKQTDKIRILLELGEADQNGSWPDYLQFGFDETDVPALLKLISDESLDQANSDSSEVWAPLHAWRTLGQLGSSAAITTLITLFDRLHDDDWALSELSKVMGMLGDPAIAPLADFSTTADKKNSPAYWRWMVWPKSPNANLTAGNKLSRSSRATCKNRTNRYTHSTACWLASCLT